MTDVTNSQVYEQLIGACIRFVSYRPRSRKEIDDFIKRKLAGSHTTAPLVLHQIANRLTELGYLNDRSFAAWWVSQRTGRKSKGAKAIRQELEQKGIAPDIIDEAITTIMRDDRSELTLAREALTKKRNVWRTYSIPQQKQKFAQYLLRRGFSSEIVWRVVDEIVGNV